MTDENIEAMNDDEVRNVTETEVIVENIAGNGEVPEIGVLLVHGIGEQPRRDTLLRFGEPIVQWLRELCYRNVTIGKSLDSHKVEYDIDVSNESELDINRSFYAPDTFNVNIKFTPLKSYNPIKDNVVIEEGELSIKEENWLFAETCWADTFSRPAFHKLAKWVFTIGPLVASVHAYRKSKIENEGVVKRFIRMFLSILVTFIVQIFTILLTILSIIPIQKWRESISKLLYLLTATLGDAYVMVTSPVQRAAAVRRVLDGIDYLEKKKCKKIAVIAHSQGAAIAAEALGVSTNIKVKLFVTYGAGITKLALLDAYHQSDNNYEHRSMKQARITLPLMFITLALWPTVISYLYPDTSFIMIAYILIVFLFAYYDFFDNGILSPMKLLNMKLNHLIWRTRNKVLFYEPEKIAEVKNSENLKLRWVNIYSTYDPVSNGGLGLDKYNTCYNEKDNDGNNINVCCYDEYAISNYQNIFTDHVTYWENKDEFVSRVVNEIYKLSTKNVMKSSIIMKNEKSNFIDISDEKYQDISNERWERLKLLHLSKKFNKYTVVLFLLWFGSRLFELLAGSYDSIVHDNGDSIFLTIITLIESGIYEIVSYYGVISLMGLVGVSDLLPKDYMISISVIFCAIIILLVYQKIYFMFWKEYNEDYSSLSYKGICQDMKIPQRVKLLWLFAILPIATGLIGGVLTYVDFKGIKYFEPLNMVSIDILKTGNVMDLLIVFLGVMVLYDIVYLFVKKISNL